MAKDTISLYCSSASAPTTRELKLARDSQGACMFRSYELSNTIPTGSEPLFSQTDWSGGMGQGNFGEPTRFSRGYRIDTSQPGQICLGPEMAETLAHAGTSTSVGYAGVDFEYFPVTDKFYYAGGHQVYVFDPVLDHWDVVWTATGTITDLHAFGGYLFVAQGTGEAYYYSVDGEDYTACTLTDHHATKFLTAPSPTSNTEILWKFLTPNQLSSNTSGIIGGAEWATPAYIGDVATDITNIFLHQDKLLVGKEDGLYHYDFDGKTYPLMAELRNYQSANNFKHVVEYKGSSIFTLGDGRIGQITAGNVLQYVDISENATDVSTYHWALNLATDGQYLYAGVSNYGVYGSDSYSIHKGWETAGGSIAWTPFATMGSGTFYNMKTWNDGTELYLWVCRQAVFRATLSGNPATDSNYVFASSGYLETSFFDAGHRDWDKIIDSALIEVSQMDDAAQTAAGGTLKGTATLSYYTSEPRTGVSPTAIDTAYSITTAGTKKYIDTAPVAAKKLSFRISLTSTDTDATPIVKYFAAYGSIRPTRVRMFDFTCYAETGQSGLSENIRDFLVSCRDATTLITLKDRFGTSHSVRILPGYPIETELSNYETKQPSVVMKVLAEKVDWT